MDVHLFDEEAYPRGALQFVNLFRQEFQKSQDSPPEFSPMVFWGENVSPGRGNEMDNIPRRIPCFCKNEITWWHILIHALKGNVKN